MVLEVSRSPCTHVILLCSKFPGIHLQMMSATYFVVSRATGQASSGSPVAIVKLLMEALGRPASDRSLAEGSD